MIKKHSLYRGMNLTTWRSLMKILKAIPYGFALIICSPLTYTSAHATAAGDAKVEQCVDTLRNADSLYEGATYIQQYLYSQIWNLDKSVSDKFSSCVAEADKDSPSNISVIYSRDGVDLGSYANMGRRYILSDAYQRKTLLDTTEKRSYELVRTPPAESIEALGGNNPNTYDRKCTRPLICLRSRYQN